MNHTDLHDAEFHDHGEQVDDPYPQMSEHPRRKGTAKITADNGDGTYTITEQVDSGGSWASGTAPGQYVGATARDVEDSTAGAVNDYVPFWEEYDEDGVIKLFVDVTTRDDSDEKVASASGETPDYLENVTAGHDPWIVLTESGGTLTWTHAGPGATCHCSGGNCITSLYVDEFGHVIRWYEGIQWYGPGGPP